MTIVLLAGFLLALAPVTGFNPHYSAAVTSLVYLFFLQGLVRLRSFEYRRKPLGLARPSSL